VLAGRTLCLLRYAVGANLAGGTWTVAVHKRGGPAVSASVYIAFQQPAS
jgi:hypothetical protein